MALATLKLPIEFLYYRSYPLVVEDFGVNYKKKYPSTNFPIRGVPTSKLSYSFIQNNYGLRKPNYPHLYSPNL
jgi:hypothetical protein